MDKKDLKIVYMGTPDFAVESLRRLVDGGYRVVGVVTMPDKPAGRHQSEPTPSPVKRYAIGKGLPLLQPAKLKDPEFLSQLSALQADLQIVVAFRMLPECVWAMPRLGTFNLHASLLPQYRGAAPINWAIINGEHETGLTTFFLEQDIDTGNIIEQVHVPIEENDTAGTLHDKLMILGGELVIRTTNRILANDVHAVPQSQLAPNVTLHAAPKIFKDTCRIDWNMATSRCYDFVRGLSPHPGAWTELINNGRRTVLKIYATRKRELFPSEQPGQLWVENGHLLIALNDGALELTEIQLSGKKRMSATDFLRGFHLAPDARCE